MRQKMQLRPGSHACQRNQRIRKSHYYEWEGQNAEGCANRIESLG